jgi:predicted GIY-YIG superfamily endonuclease
MALELKLYLLELTGDKYYVGQSDDPGFRFSEHLSGKGARWTRLHRPLYMLLTKAIRVDTPAAAMLHENWMTLKYMERFGWENVRGGDFLVVESFKLQERLTHIYDCDQNKIRYYVPDCPYLFGSVGEWHVYVLELENERFYVGSCQRLGKSLGEHFDGKSIAWTRDNRVVKVLELITIKPGCGSHLELKERLLMDYILRYGWENVRGGQMPPRQ